jgi:MFS transporter, DHA1 family, tetracycline resistance protein
VTSATISVAGAYVVDVVPKERRAASFGALGAAFSLGFVFGPALGGVLGDVNPRRPFWGAGGLSLVNTAYGYFVLPESLPVDKRRPLSWQSANPFRSFSVLGATRMQMRNTCVLFFTVASQQVFQSTFVLYAMARYGWSVKIVGLAMALYGIAGAVVQTLGTKRLVAWLGERSGVRVGLLCSVLAFFTIGATASSAICLIAISLAAMGAGLSRPSLQSLMTKEVSERRQGQLSGAITCLMGISGIMAPAIFTRVLAWGSEAQRLPGAPFVLASGLLLFALATTLLFRPLPGKSPSDGTAQSE